MPKFLKILLHGGMPLQCRWLKQMVDLKRIFYTQKIQILDTDSDKMNCPKIVNNHPKRDGSDEEEDITNEVKKSKKIYF